MKDDGRLLVLLGLLGVAGASVARGSRGIVRTSRPAPVPRSMVCVRCVTTDPSKDPGFYVVLDPTDLGQRGMWTHWQDQRWSTPTSVQIIYYEPATTTYDHGLLKVISKDGTLQSWWFVPVHDLDGHTVKGDHPGAKAQLQLMTSMFRMTRFPQQGSAGIVRAGRQAPPEILIFEEEPGSRFIVFDATDPHAGLLTEWDRGWTTGRRIKILGHTRYERDNAEGMLQADLPNIGPSVMFGRFLTEAQIKGRPIGKNHGLMQNLNVMVRDWLERGRAGRKGSRGVVRTNRRAVEAMPGRYKIVIEVSLSGRSEAVYDFLVALFPDGEVLERSDARGANYIKVFLDDETYTKDSARNIILDAPKRLVDFDVVNDYEVYWESFSKEEWGSRGVVRTGPPHLAKPKKKLQEAFVVAPFDIHLYGQKVETVHYNRNLQNGNVINGQIGSGDMATINTLYGSAFTNIEVLNAVVGANMLFGRNRILTAGYCTPLGMGVDKQFAGELRIMFNWYFGPGGNSSTLTRAGRVQF